MRRIELIHHRLELTITYNKSTLTQKTKFTNDGVGDEHLQLFKAWIRSDRCSCDWKVLSSCPDANINWAGDVEVKDCIGTLARFRDGVLHSEIGYGVIDISNEMMLIVFEEGDDFTSRFLHFPPNQYWLNGKYYEQDKYLKKQKNSIHYPQIMAELLGSKDGVH